MRTRVLLWVILGALLGLVACSSGGEDTSGQRGPTPDQRLTNAEWEQVAREAGRYLGSEVDLTGQVFNVLGTYDGAFHFQMYTDPSARKGNTHVAVPGDGGRVRSGDEVRVVGHLEREQVTTSVAGTELRVPYVVAERVGPAGQDLADPSPAPALAAASPAPPEQAVSPAPMPSPVAEAAPAAAQPPATQAPPTQAPAAQPPATQAPATQPPATQAPATQVPATQAPATSVSATQVPPTQVPTQAPPTPAPSAAPPTATPPASAATATPAPTRVASAAPTATQGAPSPAPTATQVAGPTRAPTTPTPAPSPTRVVASAPPPLPAPTATPAPRPASPAPTAEARADTYVVAAGDTLSGIAARIYGDASQYRRLYEANRDQLSSPDQLKPGQRLRVPR
ncbi:MAG: LysM peptidoglycan-binding domain-containing protein [Chloroflexi bacterium]|nr:LysM peptidoglycan-binding domain-containing protein [Chloroflexota bacterium]